MIANCLCRGPLSWSCSVELAKIISSPGFTGWYPVHRRYCLSEPLFFKSFSVELAPILLKIQFLKSALLGDCTAWSWSPPSRAVEFPVLHRALVAVRFRSERRTASFSDEKTRYCENWVAQVVACRSLRCTTDRKLEWGARYGFQTLLQSVFFGCLLYFLVFAATTTVALAERHFRQNNKKQTLSVQTNWMMAASGRSWSVQRSGVGLPESLGPWSGPAEFENSEISKFLYHRSRYGS